MPTRAAAGVTLLLTGLLLAGGAGAQTLNGSIEGPGAAGAVAPKAPVEVHRHSAGDDDAPPPALRDQQRFNDGLDLESTPGTGLAMDRSPLPGELGPTPEQSRPLFAKPENGLGLQADPWAITPK